jgi:hypothetical protein
MNNFCPQKRVLHGFTSWISITEQVLDGPPGDATRRLSSFLLIPVGYNRQGFAYVDLHRLQKTLCADARDAPVGHQVEVPTLRLNRGQPHPLTAFDAWHFVGGLKARASRRRPWYLQHHILEFQRGDATLPTWTNESASIMSDSRHNWNGARQVHVQLSEALPDARCWPVSTWFEISAAACFGHVRMAICRSRRDPDDRQVHD